MIDDQARSVSGGLGEYAWTGRERSMGDVLKDIVSNVQDMVRGEVRLAKAELREEAGRTAGAAKLIGIGAGLALLGAGFLLVSLTQLLALIMPAWVASLLVGGILAIAGFVMLGKGRAQFTVPAPHKTIENVKENVQWMKDQTKS
jgi:uncharacterized membrane protein YqjE